MILLGITFSAPDDLSAWREELGLESDLLSDASREVAIAYGAATDSSQAKAARISVLIGADGNVLATYTDIDPAAHAEQILRDLAKLDEGQ